MRYRRQKAKKYLKHRLRQKVTKKLQFPTQIISVSCARTFSF
jgi:hypothetical protein